MAVELKRRQWLGWVKVFAVFILCIVVLVIGLQYYIKPIAQAMFQKQVAPYFGDNLKIGAVNISLWQGSLLLNDVQLQQPPRFGKGTLVNAQQIQVRVALRPLFQKQLIIQGIAIKQPEINLIQSSNGQWNAEYYVSRFHDIASNSTPSNSGNDFKIKLNKFEIKNGRIRVTSYQFGQKQPVLLISSAQGLVSDLNFPNERKLPSPFSFSGILGTDRPAAMKINGQGTFGIKGFDFSSKTTIDDLELADYTYLFPESAVKVTSGRVWVVSNTKCADNYVDSTQRVDVKNLKLESNKGGFIGTVLLGLPAKMFAKFVEDKQGTFSFDFIVTGSVMNLKTNLQEAIGKAVSKSIQSKLGFKSAENGVGNIAGKTAAGIKKTGTKVKASIQKLFHFGNN